MTKQRDNRYPGGKGLAGITQWLVGMMPTHSALGADYRERERVARKLRRWSAKLQALPARERKP
ncbi:MAG: hypothetical protein H8E66_33400 [Planctomycetes bacterium]|nr:hypothetical protein [Planctomycetota bacterium]